MASKTKVSLYTKSNRSTPETWEVDWEALENPKNETEHMKAAGYLLSRFNEKNSDETNFALALQKLDTEKIAEIDLRQFLHLQHLEDLHRQQMLADRARREENQNLLFHLDKEQAEKRKLHDLQENDPKAAIDKLMTEISNLKTERAEWEARLQRAPQDQARVQAAWNNLQQQANNECIANAQNNPRIYDARRQVFQIAGQEMNAAQLEAKLNDLAPPAPNLILRYNPVIAAVAPNEVPVLAAKMDNTNQLVQEIKAHKLRATKSFQDVEAAAKIKAELAIKINHLRDKILRNASDPSITVPCALEIAKLEEQLANSGNRFVGKLVKSAEGSEIFDLLKSGISSLTTQQAFDLLKEGITSATSFITHQVDNLNQIIAKKEQQAAEIGEMTSTALHKVNPIK